jgi:phosphoglycolate phosphatase-like HAD superfamily hydrolase
VAYRAVIFDLDDTLVDTSMLASLRDERRWGECFARLGDAAAFEVPGTVEVSALPDQVRARGSRDGVVDAQPERVREDVDASFPDARRRDGYGV